MMIYEPYKDLKPVWGEAGWPLVGGVDGIIFVLDHECFQERETDDYDEYYECVNLNLYKDFERVSEIGHALNFCIGKEELTQEDYRIVEAETRENVEYWDAINDADWGIKKTLWHYCRDELCYAALQRIVGEIKKDWYGFFLAQEVLYTI
jgi:hypothetical protein